MNKESIIKLFENLDDKLTTNAEICLYGSGAFILLEQDDRTSLDIDIAAPYSNVNFKDFSNAAKHAGYEINPTITDKEHIEWIIANRLCLAKPNPKTDIILWSGDKLIIKTVSVEDLVASKLIRYDEIDQADIRYLIEYMNISYIDIAEAAERLPKQFKSDIIVIDNLQNLKEDMMLWNTQN